MQKKKQHFVPASYLKAWCDKNSPTNQEPYVWVFPKNGGEARCKSPEKIFRETDFYTVKRDAGERDLTLENRLSQLEGQFAVLRHKKLSQRKPLTSRDMSILCTFVAAMFARTKSRREFIRGQWQQVLDLGNQMMEWAENATPELREQMSNAVSTPHTGPSLSMEEVEDIVDNPIQSSLATGIATVAPALFDMRFGILDTSPVPAFITSDNPCVWFDPELFKRSPSFGAGGLVSPSVEISLPLSPTQFIIFGRKLLFSGLYIPTEANDSLVDAINRRTWANSDESFIADQNYPSFSWLPKSA